MGSQSGDPLSPAHVWELPYSFWGRAAVPGDMDVPSQSYLIGLDPTFAAPTSIDSSESRTSSNTSSDPSRGETFAGTCSLSQLSNASARDPICRASTRPPLGVTNGCSAEHCTESPPPKSTSTNLSRKVRRISVIVDVFPCVVETTSPTSRDSIVLGPLGVATVVPPARHPPPPAGPPLGIGVGSVFIFGFGIVSPVLFRFGMLVIRPYQRPGAVDRFGYAQLRRAMSSKPSGVQEHVGDLGPVRTSM